MQTIAVNIIGLMPLAFRFFISGRVSEKSKLSCHHAIMLLTMLKYLRGSLSWKAPVCCHKPKSNIYLGEYPTLPRRHTIIRFSLCCRGSQAWYGAGLLNLFRSADRGFESHPRRFLTGKKGEEGNYSRRQSASLSFRFIKRMAHQNRGPSL